VNGYRGLSPVDTAAERRQRILEELTKFMPETPGMGTTPAGGGKEVRAARDVSVRAVRVGLLAGAGVLLAVALLVAWLVAQQMGIFS
jgi:hypothetical protein